MIAMLDGMNWLGNWTRLVGSGYYLEVLLSHEGFLVIPFRYRDKCISTGGCSLFSVYI
jgi:hypothetical protein